jgi:hypothetical protein
MKRRDPGWRRGGSVVVRVLPKIPEGDFDPVYQSLQNTYTGKTWPIKARSMNELQDATQYAGNQIGQLH